MPRLGVSCHVCLKFIAHCWLLSSLVERPVTERVKLLDAYIEGFFFFCQFRFSKFMLQNETQNLVSPYSRSFVTAWILATEC